MRINFNFGQPSHSLFHVNSINSGLNSNRMAVNRAGNDRNRDRVTISPQGKMMNMIENLSKQKENIAEQRTKLVTKTLESGKDIKVIEGQLDFYSEQLENIDDQIAKITADMAKQAMEKQDEKKSKGTDEGKTAEQLETEKLSNIANATTDITQAKTVSSVKKKVDGEVRVQTAEIETDQRKIEDLKTREIQTGANVKDIIKRVKGEIHDKQDAISELKMQSETLGQSSGKKLSNASERLEQTEKPSDSGEKTENSEKAEASEI